MEAIKYFDTSPRTCLGNIAPKLDKRLFKKVIKLLTDNPDWLPIVVPKFEKDLDLFWVKDITIQYTVGRTVEIDKDIDVIYGELMPGLITKRIEIYNGKLISESIIDYFEPTYFGNTAVVYKDKFITDVKGYEEERKMLYILIA